MITRTVEDPVPLEGARIRAVVDELRRMATDLLPRMYRPGDAAFAFRLRRENGRDVLEGISSRYTAIVLLGLATEPDAVAREVLHGSSREDACGRLIDRATRESNVGAVALALWAARRLAHPRAGEVLDRLRVMEPDRGTHPTVEVSWCLSGLVVPDRPVADQALAERIASRLLMSFRETSELFPHWPAGAAPSWLRSHVLCYADLVYPIQALSYYHRATGSERALETARRCGRRMCALQGSEGQWWWHYDVRTGRVVERFPVYAVHQDAMGPMALYDLSEAGGGDYASWITRSVQWFDEAPELDGSLIDREAGVIWRKVARHEPGKLSRHVQAAASRLHPSLRAPGMDVLFRSGKIDRESRPYHMGWILYAFTGERMARL
jgi:hypothetical protein